MKIEKEMEAYLMYAYSKESLLINKFLECMGYKCKCRKEPEFIGFVFPKEVSIFDVIRFSDADFPLEEVEKCVNDFNAAMESVLSNYITNIPGRSGTPYKQVAIWGESLVIISNDSTEIIASDKSGALLSIKTNERKYFIDNLCFKNKMECIVITIEDALIGDIIMFNKRFFIVGKDEIATFVDEKCEFLPKSFLSGNPIYRLLPSC